ncbi:MAG: cold-shock protein [Gammaproteobacteria bacterium]|nr:MAG: cold-shock protein [Gammaproteobacteria bacterium]RLA62405.1 MAG: cold-shock protein [Gammaproteobacteria bacterium]
MSLIVKLIISLVIAIVASTLTTLLQDGAIPNLMLLAAFSIATVATALIVAPSASTSTAGGTSKAAAPGSKKPARRTATEDSAREQGQVKWFNVSKGFGFITKDDGEEIFVHFRSIRGEGRRSLRDGQRVSFVVAQSDKGPQAEDVEGVD